MPTDDTSAQHTPPEPATPSLGRAIAGTVYEEAARELAHSSAKLSISPTWRQTEGSYSHLLAQNPGCQASWECGDAQYTLAVADFTSREQARAAFTEFMRHNASWDIGVDGAMAVSHELDSSVSAQIANGQGTASGASWGIAAGVAVGILFPPTILATAAVGGLAGAGVGKGSAKKRAHDLAEPLTVGLAPGLVRLLLLVNDQRGHEFN